MIVGKGLLNYQPKGLLDYRLNGQEPYRRQATFRLIRAVSGACAHFDISLSGDLP